MTSTPTDPDPWPALRRLDAGALCTRRTFGRFLFGFQQKTAIQNRFAMTISAEPEQRPDNVLAVARLRGEFEDRAGLLRGHELARATVTLAELFRPWIGENGVADYTAHRRFNPGSDLRGLLKIWRDVRPEAFVRIGTVQRGILILQREPDWGFSFTSNPYGFGVT